MTQIGQSAVYGELMKKTILTFGLISGAISSLMLLTTEAFQNQIGFDRGEYLGYTTIVLSFLLVFFGIRSYRDNAGAGQITFVKGFTVGILITLISCAFYVLTWEGLYFTVMHDFMDKYGAYMIQKAQASGATAAQLAATRNEIQHYKELYANPLTNAAITFIEPFPVGLAITLLSALILRKQTKLETRTA
jgi:hypothetical protein